MTPEQMAEELWKCEQDPAYFIFTHIKTYDAQTQTIRPFAEGYPKAYKDKLKGIILRVVSTVRTGRIGVSKPDLHILKSRQAYATHVVSAIITYCFLFIPNFSAILTSQSDNKLDGSNPKDTNTFMGKIHAMVDSLPTYLKPNDADILRSNKNFKFPLNGSSIIADSGISPARGMQVMLAACDEAAEQEFMDAKLSALREAVKGPMLMFSTGAGQDNSFYRIYRQGIDNPNESSFHFETLHWKETMDPSLWEAFRIEKLKSYNGDLGMFNRNLELSFEGLVTGQAVFEMFKEDKHVMPFTKELLSTIPKESTFSLWQDFGFYAPTLLIAHTPTRSIVLETILGLGKHPDLHSKDILKAMNKWGAKIEFTQVYGDPSGVSRPREQTGASSFDAYSKALGTPRINPAINKVLEGIQQLNSCFFNDKLYILDTNTDLITGLKQAIYPTDDSGRPLADKYLLIHPQIDCIDCLRYASFKIMQPVPTKEQLSEPNFMGISTENYDN